MLALAGHRGPVRAVACSPDGQILASAGDDHTVRLWDLQTWRQRLVLPHTAGVSAVSFSSDGTLLATAGRSAALKLWERHPGDAWELRDYLLMHDIVFPVTLRFAPDGRRLASSLTGSVVLWDVLTNQRQGILPGPAGVGWCLDFLPDGSYLLAGDAHGTVQRWELATGRVRTVVEVQPGISALAVDPTGTILVLGLTDGSLMARESFGSERWCHRQAHAGRVTSLAFAPDGQTLASGSLDETLRLWDSVTGESALCLNCDTGPVHGLTFAPDGMTMAVAGDSGSVMIWDVEHTFR